MPEHTSRSFNVTQVEDNKRLYKLQLEKTPPIWQLFLDESLRVRARKAVFFVLERMCRPDFVHTTVEQAKQLDSERVDWSPVSLFSGDVGVAFMYAYAEQCFSGRGYNRCAHDYFSIAAAHMQQVPFLPPNLCSGISGLTLALSLASQHGRYYQRVLAHLHQELCQQVLHYSWRRSEVEGGVAAQDYDIIVGASGVLAYLVSIEQPDEQIQAAIAHLLGYLQWLAEPGQLAGQERWFIPAALLPTDRHRETAPRGNFNCGLAHGIPGPLAALALTWLAGYRYPGLREAITSLATWVSERHVNAPWGKDWPDSIPLEYAARAGDWQRLAPTRPSWCYGSPGVACSLRLAGQALDDEGLRLIAVEALEAAVCHLAQGQRLLPLHLCHGVAGLLQICLRFAQGCESMLIREQIPLLVEQILETFDPTFAFGFRDRDKGFPLDQATWLTGAPGIAMALLAASTPLPPTWDRALVLA